MADKEIKSRTRSDKFARFQHVLNAVATECGFKLLTDDGMAIRRDIYSDAYYVCFREA